MNLINNIRYFISIMIKPDIYFILFNEISIKNDKAYFNLYIKEIDDLFEAKTWKVYKFNRKKYFCDSISHKD